MNIASCRSVTFALFLVAAGSSVLHLPQPHAAFAMQAPAPSPAATGEIQGVVSTRDTRAPIPGADVEVAPIIFSGQTRREPTPRRTTKSGPDGSYRIAAVPAGRYSIQVIANGYWIGDTSRLVTLRDGDHLTRDFVLTPSGRIEGTITDASGKPLRDIRVQALTGLLAHSTFESAREARTDDRGHYAIPDLARGPYYVAADRREGVQGIGPGTGPPADISTYARTFYPGVPAFKDAKPVVVAPAQRINADFRFIDPATFSIRGAIVDEHGKSLLTADTSTLRFEVMIAPLPSVYVMDLVGLVTDSDGSFRLSGLAPGDYVIAGGEAPRCSPCGGSRQETKFVYMPLTITDHNINDLAVVNGKPDGEMRGRIVSSTQGAADSAFRGRLVIADWKSRVIPAAADQPFEATGLLGLVNFRLEEAGPWRIETIKQNGVALPDSMVEVKRGDRLNGIEVVVTDRPPAVQHTFVAIRADVVTRLSGKCPARSFVAGTTRVITDINTIFDDVTCDRLEEGQIVDLEGETQDDGSVLAAHVSLTRPVAR